MFVIKKESVDLLARRITDPNEADSCRRELEKMLEIKEVLSWRAEAGPGCCARILSPGLFGEVQILQAALDALGRSNYEQASELVSEFSSEAERNGSYHVL